ncbi:MAG: phosphoribosylanthranilate isomerase [Pirellulaceae bacterium]|nr:phosphoribosylanthranilate isomerase [Pirellulaceae bacterium]
MRTFIKYCGITRAEDAVLAERLGVDYLGLVFVPSSPRCVTIEQARAIISATRSVKVVGVFDDSEPERPNRLAAELGLDYVQLHGPPDPELCRRVAAPVIQAFQGAPPLDELRRFVADRAVGSDCRKPVEIAAGSARSASYFLIDKRKGEEHADLDAVAAIPAHLREWMFLAGGLDPDNVRRAVERARPFAVDCARGIEFGPGVTDHAKMSLFIENLRHKIPGTF